MRIAILGAGLMGRAAAWDLARQEEISTLLLADADTGALASARSFLEERGISPGRLTTLEVDLSSADGATLAMDGSRAVLSAMQRTTSLPAAVTTLMLADGTISNTGAFPPEEAVRPELFLRAVADRGIRIESFQVKE